MLGPWEACMGVLGLIEWVGGQGGGKVVAAGWASFLTGGTLHPITQPAWRWTT